MAEEIKAPEIPVPKPLLVPKKKDSTHSVWTTESKPTAKAHESDYYTGTPTPSHSEAKPKGGLFNESVIPVKPVADSTIKSMSLEEMYLQM